jgi:hypothetical protein
VDIRVWVAEVVHESIDFNGCKIECNAKTGVALREIFVWIGLRQIQAIPLYLDLLQDCALSQKAVMAHLRWKQGRAL